jgi:competence protein ComEC
MEPGQPLATALYQRHLAAVDAVGASWRASRAGDTLLVDGVRLIVLHPSAPWIEQEFRPNENSLVIQLEYGCFRALLTGDIGFAVEEYLRGRLDPVHVLKIGHHGSGGSTSDAFLDATAPRAAVVSVGRNRYGHPNPGVLDRLTSRNIEVFRTDRGGTVTIRSDGRYLEVGTRDWDTLVGRLMCRIRRSLQSNNSSSSRNACTRVLRVSLPTCSTTSR